MIQFIRLCAGLLVDMFRSRAALQAEYLALRHQLGELPEIRPLVTEYQPHRLACWSCGETTCAELPKGVPRGQSGPRLIAFTALEPQC